MIFRRTATAAGRVLNEMAGDYGQFARLGQMTASRAKEAQSAVRTANAVMFQYYLIPREIRAKYFREELTQEMAYTCAMHLKEECDGCGACREDRPSGMGCAVCGRAIDSGEDYYDIVDAAVCDDCIIDYIQRFRCRAEEA